MLERAWLTPRPYRKAMAILCVKRRPPSAAQGDRFRAYRIEVDGVERGKLRRGQTLRIDVAPGVHAIRARIDWQGSEVVHVDVPQEDEVLVWVTPRAHIASFWALMFKPEGWLDIEVPNNAPPEMPPRTRKQQVVNAA